MPTYDGIGETITHKLEVEGDMFLQDIEGGSLSTQVPLEIFSDFGSSGDNAINSRMLRLRVQNYGETDVSNSYVTDFGIRGEADKDYFFITAPQNTSNVGDQNTFVISKTSNVGIGTTDPGTYRLLVNNSSTKQFGVPGDDTPTTGDTLIYTEAGEWVYAFPAGNLPAGSINNEILTWNGTNWVPNSSIITTNSNTAIGIGTYTPSSNLHVIGSVTATSDVDISGKFQGGKLRVGSLLSAVPTNPNVTVPGDLTVSGTLTSDEWIHTDNVTITGNLKCQTLTASDIVGGSPLTISATSISIQTPETMSVAAPMSIGTITVSDITHTDTVTMSADIFVTEGSVLTLSKIFHTDKLTLSANVAMDSDKTLTTSNIETSNLTISNRLSGGTISVSNIEATANLVVGGPVDITGTLSSADVNVTGTVSASGSLEAAKDSDTTSYLGRAAVGYSGHDDNASFAHIDVNNAEGYAIRQTNLGDTLLNCASGKIIYLMENNSDKAVLRGGNVGIGTNNPSRKLTIKTNWATNDYDGIVINDNNDNEYAIIAAATTDVGGANSAGYLRLNPTDGVSINGIFLNGAGSSYINSGNVGIGVDNPDQKLHIKGGNLKIENSGDNSIDNKIIFAETGYNDAFFIGTDLAGGAANDQSFKIGYSASGDSGIVNSNVLMTVLGGGNVGIGTTDPKTQLHIDADGNFGTYYTWNALQFRLRNTRLHSTSLTGYTFRVQDVSSGDSGTYRTRSLNLVFFGSGDGPGTSTTPIMQWRGYDNQVYVNGAVVTTSDDRVKINEERITNATETLMKLDPQIYDKLHDIGNSNVTARESGLIVQDIWYDAPELRHLISLSENATPPEEKPLTSDNIQEDPDYSTWGSQLSSLNYMGLIPYLIKSNQEQQALIEDLRARIEALENSS